LKRIPLIIAILLIPSFLWAACGGSHPNWTATNLPDVATCQANGSFSAGDTITLTGNSTVDTGNQLTITNSMNLIGSGLPVLTRGTLAAGTALITVTLASDITVRISGIKFDNGTNDNTDKYAIYINGKTDNSLLVTKIRIDNNYFQKGKRAVNWQGAAYGLVDHNIFNNCDIGVNVSGDNTYAWARAITAGTANAVFIEDNTFQGDDDLDKALNHQIYHSGGGRSSRCFCR